MIRAGASTLLVAALLTAPVAAEVFEVGQDGAMRVSSHADDVPASLSDKDVAVADREVDGAPVPEVPAAALTSIDAPEAPDRFRAALTDAARRYSVSPSLLAALVWHESRWQPAALSSKGAIGLAQLMPATARALAVDPYDAGANLAGAAHYLRMMLDLFDGDVERALAAYDAGPARVLKAGGIPAIAETRGYVSAIIDRLGRNGTASLAGVER